MDGSGTTTYNDPRLDDEDGEESFRNHFGILDIDDTSTLEETHAAYNRSLKDKVNADDFREQKVQLKEAIWVVTSPELRKQFIETYAVKLRAVWKRATSAHIDTAIPIGNSTNISQMLATVELGFQLRHYNTRLKEVLTLSLFF